MERKLYNTCKICNKSKKENKSLYCKDCVKEHNLHGGKRYGKIEPICKLNKIEFNNFVEEMIYRKRQFFDIVDIFKMLDYWVIINGQRGYDEYDVEKQLENYWRDLIFFYSDMRKNEKIKDCEKS